MNINEEQAQAIDLALDEKVHSLFITGIGGSGKSAVINQIVRHFPLKDLVLLAPTHSAARLIGGQTLHSFFKIGMQIDTDAKKEEDAMDFNLSGAETDKAIGKVIIIDEVSMLGKKMLENIISQMPVKKLILVGDPMQLAPVRDETVDWSEYCEETVTLIENYRTANPEVLDGINYFREHRDDGVLDKLPTISKMKDIVLTSDTVCVAHKNKTLSKMQKKILGYTGAKIGDRVVTFGTSSDHFIVLKNKRTGEDMLSPYYVNGDVLRVTSEPVRYYGTDLYSVEVINEEYINKEPIHKNKKFPKPIEIMVGDHDEYNQLLKDYFYDAQEFGKEMLKKYGKGVTGEKAVHFKHKFTPSERAQWGRVWMIYMGMKSKHYARHSQFLTTYKVQGKSISDVVIHWDDMPSADHKYVALSRAINSVQIFCQN